MYNASGRLLGKPRTTSSEASVPGLWTMQQQIEAKRASLWPAAPGILLDDYPGAAAAYSLRQLRTGVTNVVRVRRDNDNAEQDFTATEVSDGTLAAWVGAGNDGFVRTWYDQSGGANHVEQVTFGLQPQIVSNGSVYLTNSKPSVYFNEDSISTTLTTSIDGCSFYCILTQISYLTTYPVQLDFGNFYVHVPYAQTLSYYSIRTGNRPDPGITTGTQHLLFWSDTKTLATLHNNSILKGTYTGGSTPSQFASVFIGSGDDATGFVNGYYQEIVLYSSDQSTNRAAIETNINAHYSIYP